MAMNIFLYMISNIFPRNEISPGHEIFTNIVRALLLRSNIEREWIRIKDLQSLFTPTDFK